MFSQYFLLINKLDDWKRIEGTVSRLDILQGNTLWWSLEYTYWIRCISKIKCDHYSRILKCTSQNTHYITHQNERCITTKKLYISKYTLYCISKCIFRPKLKPHCITTQNAQFVQYARSKLHLNFFLKILNLSLFV